MISFRVDGTPIGKQRPRFGKGKVYTPNTTTAWENKVGWAARLAMREADPFYGAVSVELKFWRKDRRRVDIDNLAKAVLDAVNGVCYTDDSQVVELRVLLTRSADWEGCDCIIRAE